MVQLKHLLAKWHFFHPNTHKKVPFWCFLLMNPHKKILHVLLYSVLAKSKSDCLEWPQTVNPNNNNDQGKDMSRHYLLANYLLRRSSHGKLWSGVLLSQGWIAYPAGTSVSVAGTIYASLTACFIKCVVANLPTRCDYVTPASSLHKLCRSHQKFLFGGTTKGQQGQIHSQETWIMLAWEILCSSDGISVEDVEMKEMLKIHLLSLILVLIFWIFAVMWDS